MFFCLFFFSLAQGFGVATNTSGIKIDGIKQVSQLQNVYHHLGLRCNCQTRNKFTYSCYFCQRMILYGREYDITNATQ